FLFFFQADDGIRDSSVTGVQTCALPISPRRSSIFTLTGWRGDSQDLRSGTSSSRNPSRETSKNRHEHLRPLHSQTGGNVIALHRSEEHTSELQSHLNLVCRLLLEKKNKH